MPRDYPDWGVVSGAVATYSLQDMAELAARLKSIVTFDRRGDVIWLDDFEDGINKWLWNTLGTGANASASAAAAQRGGFSVKMVTGNSADDYCHAIRYFSYPALSKIGFEISFTLAGDEEQYNSVLTLWDGTTQYYAAVRYDSELKTLSYYGDDAAWHVIATGIELSPYTYFFHTIKLVVDFVSNKYVRCILDSVEYDLSSYGIFTQASAVDPTGRTEFILLTKTTGSKTGYVDDAITTQNEP